MYVCVCVCVCVCVTLSSRKLVFMRKILSETLDIETAKYGTNVSSNSTQNISENYKTYATC